MVFEFFGFALRSRLTGATQIKDVLRASERGGGVRLELAAFDN
ncbi:MAG: hypothetical protein U1E87_09595 [Alphaproteobacteria bacterium]